MPRLNGVPRWRCVVPAGHWAEGCRVRAAADTCVSMVRFPPRNRPTVLAVVLLGSQAAFANGQMRGDLNISETAPDRRWSRQRMRTRA